MIPEVATLFVVAVNAQPDARFDVVKAVALRDIFRELKVAVREVHEVRPCLGDQGHFDVVDRSQRVDADDVATEKQRVGACLQPRQAETLADVGLVGRLDRRDRAGRRAFDKAEVDFVFIRED